jgi:hypothetical protein
MPLSYQSITNPSSTSFTVSFEFLNLSDIKAVGKLNSASEWTELPVTDAATSNDVTTVTVADAGTYSSAGEVRIYRATSQETLVDFQNGSRLSESDLDTAYRQGLFAAQEVRENAGENITAVGPQGPAGADGQDGADGTDGVDASNSPAFHAYSTTTTSVATAVDTVLKINTESYDTGNCFNTGNHRFTPNVAGRYHIYMSAKYGNSNDFDHLRVMIRKNGTTQIAIASTRQEGQTCLNCATVCYMNGTTDYLEACAYQASGSTENFSSGSEGTFFGAYRLIV